MIPGFQLIMRPLLELIYDGEPMPFAECVSTLAGKLGLTDEERDAKRASGVNIFYNRTGWAATHLRHANAIVSPSKGRLQITDRGELLLRSVPGDIKVKDLLQFEEYRRFAGKETDQQIGDVVIPANEESQSPVLSSAHLEIQYLLLSLGSDMGMDVWVARNDRGRSHNGNAFSSIPRMKADLPLQFDELTMRTIELIDVLWLQGNAIVAAFEIESTTSIYSGLLRMSDLMSMQPNLNIPLYLLAPEARKSKVIAEVNRPTFARLKPPLSHVCRYIPFASLQSKMQEVANVTKYLKPDFLRDISEDCRVE
jgi:hypothetical protein